MDGIDVTPEKKAPPVVVIGRLSTIIDKIKLLSIVRFITTCGDQNHCLEERTAWVACFFLSQINNRHPCHSGCLDLKKFLSTIDLLPGVPGVSKNHIFSTNETVLLLR